ncbi:MAG: 30S ribosomal protein S16 [candidate division WOR-3 bacterium]
MVRIRLRRMGLRNRPTYRVVAIDSRRARDSRYIELLGHYDPRRRTLELRIERVRYWLSSGAQPSSTVSTLIQIFDRQTKAAAEPGTALEQQTASDLATTTTEGVQP